jgi:hypothetical protein
MGDGHIRPEGCNCPLFKDVFPFRMADLTCPVHGVEGMDPGDGEWEVPSHGQEGTDG